MKQIVIFIGLKLAELCVFLGIVWGAVFLCKYGWWVWFWRGLSILVSLLAIVGVLCLVIKENWQWAKKLAGKE